MFTFLKKKPCSSLGLDISATSVKILELSYSQSQYCVEGYGCVQLSHIDVVSSSIKALLASANLSSKQVILAVPDACAIRKIIQIKADVHEQDIDEWVLMEAEKYIPHPVDEINLDFNILGPSADHSDRLDVLVVAARAEKVKQRVDLINNTGLAVQIVDVESCAIERSASLCITGHGTNTAMFDIGEVFIRCFVFNGLNIIFSREDALGAEQSLPRCFELILQQIKRALQFFSSSNRHGSIDQILLSGIVLRFSGLDGFLQSQLGIPTHIANPFIGMSYATPLIRRMIERDAPELMVACGLALRGVQTR